MMQQTLILNMMKEMTRPKNQMDPEILDRITKIEEKINNICDWIILSKPQ